MENVFNLTPLQSLLIIALNIWIFVIFPTIVIKKLNYMTDLLESHFYNSDESDSASSEETQEES